MKDILFGITFLASHMLGYLIAISIAAFLLLAYKMWRTIILINFLGNEVHGHRFLKNVSKTRSMFKAFCMFAALILIAFTLLRPAWNKKESRLTQHSRDIFIALDISRSMLAHDIAPNRLSVAKAKIKELVQALATDRVGLILFSGSSFIQCPLTHDLQAFYMFLNQVDTDTIASGTTALDRALAQALQAFKESGTQKNKLLVIFTDGEDFSSNLADLKKEAQQQGLTIFTVGIGTSEGAPIPLFDITGKQQGHVLDKKGAIVISKLNEPLLYTLANDIGGIYIRATDTNTDIKTIVSLIQQKEKEKGHELKHHHVQEQYPLFLAVALLILLVEFIL